MMTPAIALLGTHSNAGKSLLAAAFCRILARQGYRVAPFKAQNMSNNAGVTPQGGEMGRAQLVQSEAAGIEAHTDMNPVLLKPEGNRRSQIVLNGQMYGHLEAGNWYDVKQHLWQEVCSAYDRLADRFDVIVIEGAGSPAEINLKDGDIANLRMAAYAQAPALLIGDIDRGGVFAALAGTMLLLEPEERQQIKGFLINKFRGDPALLGNGLQLLQQRAYNTPTLGIIPYLPELQIADEDAVALENPLPHHNLISSEPLIDIAILQLPHIANFDEFDALKLEPGVRVRYIQRADELGEPQVVILPGSKVTLADLAWMEERGLGQAVRQAYEKGAEIVGICGGYQMLGQRLVDPFGIEGPAGSCAAGLQLLPIATEFHPEKQTHQAKLQLHSDEILQGYEIHVGKTKFLEDIRSLGTIIERNGQSVQQIDGAISQDSRVWGTYLHNIFANDAFRRRWLRELGWQGSDLSLGQMREAEYDRLADAVEGAVDWAEVLKLMHL